MAESRRKKALIGVGTKLAERRAFLVDEAE